MKNKVLVSLLAVIVFSLANVRVFADDSSTTPNTSIARGAYSRVAPFVNNETFLVVRLDLDSLNEEAVGATFNEIFTGFLKERGFDKNALNASNREFKKTLEIIKSEYKTALELRDALGIREIFLLMQKQIGSLRIIVPLSSSQRASMVQLSSQIPSEIGVTVSEVSNGVCLTLNKELDADIYKDFKAETNATLKSFLTETAGATIQVYCSDLKLKKLLNNLKASTDESINIVTSKLPPDTLKGIDSFDTAFQTAKISYDFNTFAFKSVYTFTTAERAEDFRSGLEKLVILGAESIADSLQESEIANKYNLNGLARELFKGTLLSFVPQRNDSVLSYDSNLQSKQILSHPCFTIMLEAIALQILAQQVPELGSLNEASDVLPQLLFDKMNGSVDKPEVETK